MGRIRGKATRRYTIEVLKSNKADFGDNFESNKAALNKLLTGSKAERNKIAGYITKLAKGKKIEEFIIGHSTQ